MIIVSSTKLILSMFDSNKRKNERLLVDNLVIRGKIFSVTMGMSWHVR